MSFGDSTKKLSKSEFIRELKNLRDTAQAKRMSANEILSALDDLFWRSPY